MRITVAIVSYKYGHLVAQAIDSVLSQTKKPDDIVVIDDGAHDGVDKVAEMYGVRSIIRPKNLGIVANFNDILYNVVTTERVLMLGADNWLRPDTLELLSVHQEDIVSYNIFLCGQQSKEFADVVGAEPYNGYYFWKFRQGNIQQGNFIHGSALYNACLAREVGGYKESGGKNTEEDWVLWQRMINRGATIRLLDEPLLYYRRHKQNHTTL